MTAITILTDNHAAYGFEHEHGFSLWIETAEKNVLFDTGCGDAIRHNVGQLGISLAHADDVVLSHGHYDHTGNLADVLHAARRARLHLHPDALKPRHSIHERPRPIGMPKASSEAVRTLSKSRLDWVEGPKAILEGVWMTGAVPRMEAGEDTGGPFFDDEQGQVADEINDDQSLWLETPHGLVVCLGCCHAGVINTLKHILDVTGQTSIYAVLGGMHLVHADAGRIDRTAAYLKQVGVSLLVPCHCTGDAAVRQLGEASGPVLQPGFAGHRFAFGGEFRD